MNGNDFLILAGKLAAQTTYGPAGYRTAASRAYYGAYHLARQFLAEVNIFCPGSNANEHLWVQRMFRHCEIAQGMEIGILLSNLHESRKSADYDLNKTELESQTNAQISVLRGDDIHSRLIACSDHAISSRIEQGIRKYRRQIREE
ncbi:MAG: hypothetical protein K8T91_18340 [Planctomycetes bacterium]|nr:hypothetical protein [Planctomycetota bacterium]